MIGLFSGFNTAALAVLLNVMLHGGDVNAADVIELGSNIFPVPPRFPSASSRGVKSHPIQPNPELWNVSKTPLPTNAWWDNLVLGGGVNTISPLPYLLQAKSQGLDMCYPGLVTNQNYVLSVFLPNIRLTVKETVTRRHVVAHDDLSVTMEWISSHGSLRAIIVQGSPYITFVMDHLTPVLSTIHALLEPANLMLRDTKFRLRMNNGQTWLLHASQPLTLLFKGPGDPPEATLPFTGVLRFSLPSNKAWEGILDSNRYVYPIGGAVHLAYSGDEGIIRYSYETEAFGEGERDLLMLALPHHMDAGVLAKETVASPYKTIKGHMTGVVGKKWTVSDTLPKIAWKARSSIASDKREAVRAALLEDEPLSPHAQDPYFYGKEIAAMGRLALIADELGESAVAARIRTRMKSELRFWFNSKNSDPLVYENTWGGIVSLNSLHNIGADFGNAAYNDHHYHYGYFVYAAAVLGRKEPQWLQDNLAAVLDLVRDYANPNREDPYFFYTRHKDMYAWHSWAGGLFSAADAKNQESTSEAVNAYYAVHLLGLALNDQRISNFGRILMQMEIRSSRKYWQIVDTEIYSEPYASRTVVGVLWSTKVDYATWFGGNLEYIHGIQYLPITPISEELLPARWITKSYPVINKAIKENPNMGDEWLGYMYMAHAIIDPSAAWSEVQALKSFLGGNTKTNTLYWIATRPTPSAAPQGPSVNLPENTTAALIEEQGTVADQPSSETPHDSMAVSAHPCLSFIFLFMGHAFLQY